MSVSSFEEKLTRRRSPNRQTADNEWARAEPEVLFSLLALQRDQLDSIEFSQYLLRDL